MATTTISGSTVVFSNSTAAADLTATGDEDGSLSFTFNVLAASGGGTNTTIYSVDNGIADDNNTLVTVKPAFSTYDTDLLYSDATAGSWQLNGDTSVAGAHVWIGTDNMVHYDASNLNASVIQHAGAGEFFTDTFKYTIKMSNGTLSVGTIGVAIAGENDAAQFGIYSGSVTEDGGSSTTEGTTETAVGTLTFTDADWHDTHTASVKNNSNLGSLTASVTTDNYTADGVTFAPGNAATGAVSLSYAIADSAINYLSQGQQKIETFTIDLRETHPDNTTTTDSTTVSYTITGTNDPAAFAAGGDTGGVTEDHSGGASETAGGTLGFTDADLADTHTVGFSGGTYGTLDSLAVGTDSTGQVDNAGTVDWHYTVANSAIDFLSQGQQVADSFTVALTEHSPDDALFSHEADHTVTITLTGSNDAAVFGAGGDSASIVDDAGGEVDPETANGTLTFTDADWADMHTVSVTGTGLGTLTIDPSDVTDTSHGLGGQINWHYSITDAALDALTSPTSDTFTVHLVEHHPDNSTSEVTHDVTINLTGGADAVPDQAPVVNNDTWIISDNTSFTITPDWMTWNDSDPDGGTTFVSSVSGLPTGWAASTASGHVTQITAAGIAAGTYTLTYSLSDGILTSTGTVTVNVRTTSTANSSGGGDSIDLSSVSYDHSYIDLKNGDDKLAEGTASINYVTGGGGQDQLTGSTGTVDHFIYKSASDSQANYNPSNGKVTQDSRDTIFNFVSGEDKIDLTALGPLTSAGAVAGTTIAANSFGWKTDGTFTDLYVNTSGSPETITDGSSYNASMEIHLANTPSILSTDILHV